MSPRTQRSGRPRDPQVDRAIIDATLELVAARGTIHVSVEAIASEAGVSTASIYRRYETKEQLLVAAVRALEGDAPVIDTGTLRGDVRSLVEHLQTLWTGRRGRIIPQLVAEAVTNDRMHDLLSTFVVERLAIVQTIVNNAIDRGEVAPGVPTAVIADALVGAVFLRHLGGRGLHSSEEIDALTEIVLRGLTNDDR